MNMSPSGIATAGFEREIQIAFGGVSSAGFVRVGPVTFITERKAWACNWSISRIHDSTARIYGDDPIQAFSRCLQFLGTLIRGHEEDGWGVHWQVPGDHAGFDVFLSKERDWPNQSLMRTPGAAAIEELGPVTRRRIACR